MDLPSRLSTTRPSLETLRAWLDSGSPLEVHAVVAHLRQRWREGQEDAFALAELVPASRWTHWPPETQLELARLAVSGFPVQVPPPPEGLSLLVWVEWMRAALLSEPLMLGLLERKALGDAPVRQLPAEGVLTSGLLEPLLGFQEPAVQRAGLDSLRTCLERALLAPAQAQAWLLKLADAARPMLAAEALELLAQPWALSLPCPPLRHFLERKDEAALSAVHVLRARRDVDTLRELLRDERFGPVLHREALGALGAVGAQEDVRLLLERALAEPARFGREALLALVHLRRRGLSPSPEESYSVLGLYLENPAVEPSLAAEVLSSRADTVLAAFDAARAPGLDWPRWLSLLEALETQGTRERFIALVEVEEGRPGWDEVIRALGRMEAFEAEPALLRRLPDAPEACLFALARIGGVATVGTLRELLAREVPARPAWHTQAAEVLLRLDPGPSTLARVERLELLTPSLVRALPAHVSGVELELLAGLVRRPGDPRREAAIAALGRTGGPLAIELLAELLTDPEETTRQQVHAALRALGVRLAALGATRPACLTGAKAPGDAVLAEALLRRVERGGLSEEALLGVLEALRGLTHPRLVRVVRPLLRRRSAEVRKRVIPCLAAAGLPSTAWLVPLLEEDDVLVARQVLLALGEVGASEAAGRVADWLEHPNMNLKKTAAEALARATDPGVAERLLSWLARHDNPGLRGLLRTALRASTGPWFRSRVVAALDAATSPRAVALLVEVLDGELTPEDVGALASREEPWAPVLLRLVYGGRVALVGGSLAELDAELSRRDPRALRPLAENEPPSSELRPALQRAEAERHGRRLKFRLREEPVGVDPELLALLERARGPDTLSISELTWTETRALFDVHARVERRAQVGIERLLASVRTPFTELALASLLERFPDAEHPVGAEAASVSRWDLDTARRRLTSPDAHTRKLAAQVVGLGLALNAPELLAARPEEALSRWVDEGAHEALARWSLLESGPEPVSCARALARVEGPLATVRILEGWLERYPEHTARIARGFLVLGEAADERVRALVGSTRLDTRARVHLLEGLAGRGDEAHLTLLRHALKDALLPLRREAARQLLARKRPEDRRLVLGVLLAGELGEDFRFSLQPSDEAPLTAWMRERHPEPAWLAGIGLLGPGAETWTVPLLLEAWRTAPGEARARARDMLRGCALERVLPHALPPLREGQWEWLEVLGGEGLLPAELVRVAAEAPGAADAWSRAFVRMAGGRLLHAPGLLTPLLQALGREPTEARLHALARLTDWYEPEGAERITRALGALLTGEHRPLLLDTLLAATRPLPVSWRVRLLSEVALPSDTRVVDALVDAVLEVPALREGLPEALRARVEACLREDTFAGDAERVRRILSFRVESARSEREKREVVELLERSLGHRRARVRHHAHRLLATQAPRERYLRATYQLLTDTDPQTVRRGIRVLTFGGEGEVAPTLARLLSHREPTVRRAAREGLLVLGPRAVVPLTKAAAHVRPDHREAVLEVLELLRAREG